MNNRKLKPWLTVLVIFLLLLSICAYTIFILSFLETWEIRGAFGSAFGAVGSLFAGLSLIGIIYSLRLQHVELELSRVDIEAQQRESLIKQFEDKYFLLYQDLLLTAKDLSIEYNNKKFTGKRFFEGAYLTLKYSYGIDWENKNDGQLNDVMNIYNKFLHRNQHYYSSFTSKTLFLLNYLDKQITVPFIDKHFYSKLLNNELSSFAMVLLYYHAIYKMKSTPEFLKLISDYNVLEFLNQELLLSKGHEKYLKTHNRH